MTTPEYKPVKKAHAENEYTPYMIEEMGKCANDFFYFCKYIKIVHPDYGKVTFVPRWYQKEILEKIINNRNFIGLASRQVGKCVFRDTPITVRNKTTGETKDVRIDEFYNDLD